MLVATFCEKDLSQLNDFEKKVHHYASLIEIRLDALDAICFDELKKIMQNTSFLPFLLTLRSTSQGGFFEAQKQNEREKILKKCFFELKPAFLDIEVIHDLHFIKKLSQARKSSTKLIASHHFLKSSRKKNFEDFFYAMKNSIFYHYKIALEPKNFSEAFSFLQWIKEKNASERQCTGILLGKRLGFTRLLDVFLNNSLHFFSLDFPFNKIPGHFTLSELENIYRYQTINQHTHFYALIGKNVIRSQGHFFHNDQFMHKNKNARYVKIALHEQDIEPFFQNIHLLPFFGFSITSPYKKRLHEFFSVKTPYAINSLSKIKNLWQAENTDLLALKSFLAEKQFEFEHKKILVVGTGATAEIFAHFFLQNGATIFIESRSDIRKKLFKKKLGEKTHVFSKKHPQAKNFDLIVYTIPGDKNFLNLKFLHKKTLFVDLRWPKKNQQVTPFIKIAKKQGCSVIDGIGFFKKQATLQQGFFCNACK